VHDSALQYTLDCRSLSWLGGKSFGAFNRYNLYMLIKEGLEILSELRYVSTTMLEKLSDLLIESQSVQEMLEAEKCVTTRRRLTKSSLESQSQLRAVHYLSLCDLFGEYSSDTPPVLVNLEHDLDRLRRRFHEERFEDVNYEFHRRKIIV
jgi:hypothetical protein